MKLFSVAEMVEAERIANAAGHRYADMMEIAGRGVAEAIIARVGEAIEELAVLVLVGTGNNGGDALVAGRYLHWAGANVVFYLIRPRDPDTDDNLRQILDLGLPVLNAEDDQRFRVLRLRLNGVDCLIDGLLGTGVTRPITGELAKLLRQTQNGLDERAKIAADAAERARQESGFEVPMTGFKPHPITSTWRPTVVAVDCPSGLNCDTGAVDPLTLSADLTVTFGGPKRGHFLSPGAAVCGELIVADIGIDRKHLKSFQTEVATQSSIVRRFPARPQEGHKGTFGKVLVIGGSNPYRGAPLLTGRAAFRAGSGLVGLLTPRVVRDSNGPLLQEATWVTVDSELRLDGAAVEPALDDLHRRDALCIGPGLGTDPATAEAFFAILDQIPAELPVVIDADGLNLLAADTDWPSMLPPRSILTPHPGEMKRLCQLDRLDSRIDLAREKAAAWGCVLLLKGAHTVIAAPDGRVELIPFAHSILSTAGSGDVLSGVILSLLGQGLSWFDAAVVGAYWHASAGVAWAEQQPFGALAHEIADQLPRSAALLTSRSR